MAAPPPGFFPLPPCSGAAPAKELFGTARLPHICMGAAMKCIDDPDSRHYNRTVDASQGSDRRSCEDGRRQDGCHEFRCRGRLQR